LALVTSLPHITFTTLAPILPVITLWSVLTVRTFMPFPTFALGIIATFIIVAVIAAAPAVAETVAALAILVTIEVAVAVALLEIPARAVLKTLLSRTFFTLRTWLCFAFGKLTLALRPWSCLGRIFSLGFLFALRSGFHALFLAILFAEAAGKLDRLAYWLGSEPHPVVVVSELEIALSHHRIAGGLRIPPELHVFFSHGLRSAAQFHVRSVRVKDLVGAVAAAAAAASTATMAVAVAATLVVMLSWSHVSQSTVHCRNQLQPQKSCLPLWVL
jgi:hypothetical protein